MNVMNVPRCFSAQILVHVGFLTEESGDVFSPKVLKGGPLGEMVQWADILTALHVLGHNLKISMSVKELHGCTQRPAGSREMIACCEGCSHVVNYRDPTCGPLQQEAKQPPQQPVGSDTC
ncbi:unnamed protein product [Boreogadus saida]